MAGAVTLNTTAVLDANPISVNAALALLISRPPTPRPETPLNPLLALHRALLNHRLAQTLAIPAIPSFPLPPIPQKLPLTDHGRVVPLTDHPFLP